MRINEQDLKKIKALHVALKMPVWVLDEKTNEILKSYTSIYKYPISYEFKKRIIAQNAVEFYSGILNEIFLCLKYKNVKIVMGAFRINNVSRKTFSLVYNNMTEKNKKMLKEEECWEYYSTLPVYPLGDIRDYLSLLGFLFDMELEDGYSAELHKQVEENQFELKNHFLKENFTIHLELSAILFIMKIKL